MKKLLSLMSLMSLSLGLAPTAWSQSYCASDGQAAPTALVERFINADCAPCWSAAPTPDQTAGALTLDWIVPGGQGDDAPLSAAASRDALMRLEALGRVLPTTSATTTTAVAGGPVHMLRVAHGVALGGYIGAVIELATTPVSSQNEALSAWLALVESIPAGTEGTVTNRNLVRNVLLLSWNKDGALSIADRLVFREIRPLNIPQGASPERLRVVGWVQDARGRVLTAAQSVCAPDADR